MRDVLVEDENAILKEMRCFNAALEKIECHLDLFSSIGIMEVAL